MYDAIIVGGGPAGLSAALVLARCRRKVLVCDAGNPRNARAQAMHGFLTRDGTFPGEFLQMARAEIEGYGVERIETTVMSAEKSGPHFAVKLRDDRMLTCRKLLVATGVVDVLPDLPGVDEFYGSSVHHCPYCDGWEHRGQPIAVYGHGSKGAGLALAMLTWTEDVILLSNGPAKLNGAEKKRLKANAIRVYEPKVQRLEGSGGMLERIVFADGSDLVRRAIFFNTANVQRSALPTSLGCEMNPKGAVKTTRGQACNVPGLYIAGDAAEDSQFVIVAAAEGAKAAMSINTALQKEDQGL